MGHAAFVFGAAGAGKTTFCRNLREYAMPGRKIRLVNLDPANETADDYDVDICDHITVDEVMENCDFGPNGALFIALREMMDNIELLELEQFEDEYFIFDCPGQIELFLHSNIMSECIDYVKRFAKVAIIYLSDSMNFSNVGKHLHASLCATICMSRFCLPILNIISKTDLIDADSLDRILRNEDLSPESLGDDYFSRTIIEYVESSGMLDYLPLDWNNEDTVENILMQMDNVLQRFDDIEPSKQAE